MSQPKAKLVVTGGGTIGREYPITQNRVLIGRWDNEINSQPDIDLSEDDLELSVSRKHAYITLRDGNFYWEDCSAQNPSYIDRNKTLAPLIPHPLDNGSELVVGKLFLRFFILAN